MTWLSRICFSALFSLPLLAGSVVGSVQLVDSRDPGVRKHKNYSGVVVWLQPTNHAPAVPAAALPKRVQMVQKGKRFNPHILAISVGTTVEFPNFDPIFHNAFSNFSGQPFDIGLYPPGTSQSVTFRREGIVRVFCNIHPTMSAVIAVLRTPWFAVTGPSGAFEIPDVPAGEYQLHVFHERATPKELQGLEHKIAVNGGRNMLASMSVSETGYLPVPHKNKHGMDYPPVTDDVVVYPGANK